MKQGFTLVELAIVIVIIGLIVSGVVGANSLIESSKKQNAIKQMNNLSVAIKAFQLEFDAFPGDMRDATEYWGTTEIENGDGDGRIGGTYAHWVARTEFVQFWEHLESAEIFKLDGHLSENTDAFRAFDKIENTNVIIGYKKPLSVSYWHDSPGFKMKKAHGLYIVDKDRGGSILEGKLSSNQFLYPIDKKIDDGLSGSGNIIARDGSNTPNGKLCVKSSLDGGFDTYNLNQETASNNCIAMWYLE